jgi:hypothetical protein
MAKHYGVRGDLTIGGPVNFRMRRNPFPIRVKLTMRWSRPNLTQSQRHGTMGLQLDSCPSDTLAGS